MSVNLTALPANLLIPQDDGACDHLFGLAFPNLSLSSTTGEEISPRALSLKKDVILFCYPMTGRPGVALPDGWDNIPGARGCTPQNCAFKDNSQEFSALDAQLIGVSTQDTTYQKELVERIHLPYPILSDSEFKLIEALSLPTMVVANMTLIKRLTVIIRDGTIAKVFYPVFPSNKNPSEILRWLKTNSR